MRKILDIIRKFWSKITGKNKVLLLEENFSNNRNNKDKFKQSIDLKKENEIRQLQEQYEKGEIKDNELTPIQVMNLIELYNNQIKELNLTIEFQKLILGKNN